MREQHCGRPSDVYNTDGRTKLTALETISRWVTLSADFRGNGASPTNHCWYQSSRVIALSCGIKIYAVSHLVLSQSTRVTDRQTDRQNYDSQDRPRICSLGKNTQKRKEKFAKRLYRH